MLLYAVADGIWVRESVLQEDSIPRAPVREAKYHRLPACIERRHRLVRVLCEDDESGLAEHESEAGW